MGVPAFAISGLTKSFGGIRAIDDISLEIAPGSMNFLLGANGSGKSTLIKCLAGLEYWDKGSILLNGEDRAYDRPTYSRGIHLISEDLSPPLVSLAELKRVYQSLYPNWDEAVFQKFLAWSEMDISRNLTQVSRGQKVQAILALTLAVQPEILLIDEATAVLDPFIRARLMSEIEQGNRKNSMTTIIATNIASEIVRMRGRLLIMRRGQIAVDRASHDFVQDLCKIRAAPDQADAIARSGFCFIEQNEDGSWSFIGPATELPRLGAPHQLDARAMTIEEIFIYHSDRSTK